MGSLHLATVPHVERSPHPYVQVAAHYIAEIQSGHLKPGEQLPSIQEIAANWGVARSTVQRALDLLKTEGWIDSSAGRRSVVLPRKRTP